MPTLSENKRTSSRVGPAKAFYASGGFRDQGEFFRRVEEHREARRDTIQNISEIVLEFNGAIQYDYAKRLPAVEQDLLIAALNTKRKRENAAMKRAMQKDSG